MKDLESKARQLLPHPTPGCQVVSALFEALGDEVEGWPLLAEIASLAPEKQEPRLDLILRPDPDLEALQQEPNQTWHQQARSAATLEQFAKTMKGWLEDRERALERDQQIEVNREADHPSPPA
jgi:hypothetical protein